MSVEASVGVESGTSPVSGGGIKSFGYVYESVAYSPIDGFIGKGEIENTAILRFDQPGQIRTIPSVEEETSSVALDETSVVHEGEVKAKVIWAELTNQKEGLTADVLDRALKARAAVQPMPEVVPYEPANLGSPKAQEVTYQDPQVQLQFHPKGANLNLQGEPVKKFIAFGLFLEEKTSSIPKQKDEVAVEKRRIVRDGKALLRRIFDGLDAIKRAFTNPDKEEVTGKDVQIPLEYDEVRSTGLKQEGENVPDGGYEKYKNKAEVRIAGLTSPIEIAHILEEEAYDNEPVKRDEGEGGKRVGQEAVFNAFKYASKIPPVEEFRVRLSKKEAGIIQAESRSVPSEQTIHEYPDLAEALQAA
ncbi:MAG: hypothetical protein AAB414_05495 [Patescibacteria group bacterium]